MRGAVTVLVLSIRTEYDPALEEARATLGVALRVLRDLGVKPIEGTAVIDGDGQETIRMTVADVPEADREAR